MTDAQSTHIVVFTAREGMADRVKEVLMARVTPTRGEAGNLAYDLFQGKDDPRVFVLYEEWADQAALDRHSETPYIKSIGGDLAGALAVPFEVTRLNMLSPVKVSK